MHGQPNIKTLRTTLRSLFFLCWWTFCTLSNCWINLNTRNLRKVPECSAICCTHKRQLCSSAPECIFSVQYFFRKSMLLFSVSVMKRNASDVVKITQVQNFSKFRTFYTFYKIWMQFSNRELCKALLNMCKFPEIRRLESHILVRDSYCPIGLKMFVNVI